MVIVPPEILKIAREFLALSQEQVEAHSGVSRATIQRIERGTRSLPQYSLLIQHFYEENGIEFVAPTDGRGWGLFNHNTIGQAIVLNRVKATKTTQTPVKQNSARKIADNKVRRVKPKQ